MTRVSMEASAGVRLERDGENLRCLPGWIDFPLKSYSDFTFTVR